MKKILSIFILVTVFLSIFNIINTSYAINPTEYKPSDLGEETKAVKIGNKIIGAFQAIGSIVSVIALIAIGIKYMTGSVDEKAEYKQTMMYYLIGAILVFAISNISAIIYNFAGELNK